MAAKISLACTVAQCLVECELCGDRSRVADTPDEALLAGLEHLATVHPKLDPHTGLDALRLWTFQKPEPLAEIADEAGDEGDEAKHPTRQQTHKRADEEHDPHHQTKQQQPQKTHKR